MIYSVPILDETDRAVLRLIEDQKARLSVHVQHNPKRWMGSIRKRTFAKAIQGSNSIEGYNASIEDALAAVDDEPPPDERTETWFAISGYRAALTYVMQAAKDRHFQLNKQFLKSLHFMMIGWDLNKNPGQWRPRHVFVVSTKTNETVYTAPDVEHIEKLMDALMEYLTSSSNEHFLVRAAMAHLNLTLIHPFSDGNGRMARAIQTLIISLNGVLEPIFSSIEEWLGQNTQEYYDILQQTAKGEWSPNNSALDWVRFCLIAHYQQASTLLRRIEEYEKLYNEIMELIEDYSLNERMALPLFDAALGQSSSRAKYQEQADVTSHTASRDLKRLSDLELLAPTGNYRGRRYWPSEHLKKMRDSVRIKRPLRDPYDIVERDDLVQQELPL